MAYVKDSVQIKDIQETWKSARRATHDSFLADIAQNILNQTGLVISFYFI